MIISSKRNFSIFVAFIRLDILCESSAEDSHEISCLFFLKIKKDGTKFVVCCSRVGALRFIS